MITFKGILIGLTVFAGGYAVLYASCFLAAWMDS